MGKRPGVMLYFDVRPCLKRLSLEEKGQLFEAILDYGEHGVLPELDGACGIAWDFIQPRIDQDGAAYKKACAQRKHAVYCRECKRNGIEPLTFDKWVASGEISIEQALSADNATHRPMRLDNERYPTTNSKSTTTTTSTSTTESTYVEGKLMGWVDDSAKKPVDFEVLRKEQMRKLAAAGRAGSDP